MMLELLVLKLLKVGLLRNSSAPLLLLFQHTRLPERKLFLRHKYSLGLFYGYSLLL